jgi:hypothetical protein
MKLSKFQGDKAKIQTASGNRLEDWIGEVSICKQDLVEKEKWKESDICIIQANTDFSDPLMDWKFYLMLKSR